LLGLDVDILIPAALEDVITLDNVDNIKAKVMVEVANGPTASDADARLGQRMDVMVIPDILANAGGVTVSYFEWVQNREGYYWELSDIHARLQKIMATEFNNVLEISQKHSIDMRTAAYVHALNRIGEAVEAQGTRHYYNSER
jgi:glutamate dehydrogenase (NADP+)